MSRKKSPYKISYSRIRQIVVKTRYRLARSRKMMDNLLKAMPDETFNKVPVWGFLGLPRWESALCNERRETIGSIRNTPDEEMLKFRNVGVKGVKIIRDRIQTLRQPPSWEVSDGIPS